MGERGVKSEQKEARESERGRGALTRSRPLDSPVRTISVPVDLVVLVVGVDDHGGDLGLVAEVREGVVDGGKDGD